MSIPSRVARAQAAPIRGASPFRQPIKHRPTGTPSAWPPLPFAALILATGIVHAVEHGGPFPLGPDAGAEARLRETLARDLNAATSAREQEADDARFLFPDLRKALDMHGPVRDAGIYTGVNDPSSLKIADVSSASVGTGRAIVFVGFTNLGGKDPMRFAYDLRKAGHVWRLYDVTYFSRRESARQVLKLPR